MIRFVESDHIFVSQDSEEIVIGAPPNAHAKDVASVVNFQLGYELMRLL